jgi:hypothetical protein
MHRQPSLGPKLFVAPLLVLLLVPLMAAPQRPAPAADSRIDVATADGEWPVPQELTFRARVAAIVPAEKVDIAWRDGGEGLGGAVFHGVVGTGLEIGQWSPDVEVASLISRGKFPRTLFLTITTGRSGKYQSITGDDGVARRVLVGASRDVQVEFEFRFRDKPIKRFTERGPYGGTVGVVIPISRLGTGKSPDDPEFVRDLCGLLAYAQRRAEQLEALPWARRTLPKRFAIQTDLGGYGEGVSYGIRTTDRDVISAEVRSLRQIGVNGLRNAPQFLLDAVARGAGADDDLRRIRDMPAMGFPVAPYKAQRNDSRKKAAANPEAGCPFAPGVAERTKAGIAGVLATLPHAAANEAWGLTVDEIGSVFDATPEGKQHVAICPRCAEGFREYLRTQGLSPGDFGAADWAAVKPLDSFAKDFQLTAVDRATGLRAYYTTMFVNYATARLFTPLRDTLARLNREKQAALDANERGSAAAKRPFLYSYALRGNTFLMGGHSLDFFDFYRYADNAFVYEMSNRDPRIWQWDGYLCDVGRMVSSEQGLQFGVYVKPHRGAPIQRALAAISRNAQMLYWYTYGPDWSKGDTFAGDARVLAACSKAARLIGQSEDVLYGSTWAEPAEVGVVFPRSSELWMRLSGTPPDRAAAYENAKWIYTALAHAHLPADPLDEGMLAERSLKDLARYKVIYVSGPNLLAAAAEKLTQWVHAGGTLYTSGGGLRFDEANQPLVSMSTALGLESRTPLEMWKRVELYKATALESYDDRARRIAAVPSSAKVKIDSPATAEFLPIIGREVLAPAAGAETLARFADGGAAVVRSKYGAGTVWIVGLFPGLEYSAPLRRAGYDMSRDLSPSMRKLITLPCQGLVRPVVDCEDATVEGVLLRNKATGKLAVTLMNWTYRVAQPDGGAPDAKAKVELVLRKNLKLRIRGTQRIGGARSAATGDYLPATYENDQLIVTLPQLKEGDVLLLE